MPGGIADQPARPIPGYGAAPSFGAPSQTGPNGSQYYNGPTPDQGNYTWDPVAMRWGKTPAGKAKDLVGALDVFQNAGYPVLGSSSAAGGGGGAAGAGGAGVPAPVDFPDTSGARAASFARAKDTAAETSNASIKALQGLMASTGRAGSRVEGSALGQIVGSAGQGVNELGREQAIQDVNSENQRASQAYSGAIAQRGQNIQLAVQEAARRAQAMQGLISAIGGAGILY